MKYLYAVHASFIALLIFIIIAIFVPGAGPSRDVEIILTISTFLFAILSGFFISRLNSRYNKIRDFSASEDAYWFSFYHLSKRFDKTFSNKIKKIIDNYYIELSDFGIENYYKPTSKYINKIYLSFDKLKVRQNLASVLSRAFAFLGKIEENRNKISVIVLEKLTFGQWTLLLLLSSIIIFSVFYLKTSIFYSQIIAVILSTILILILFIIRDLQNFKLFGKSMLSESEQEIFEELGNLRYYNQFELNYGFVKIPKNIKEYRLGLHEPGEKFKIKIFKKNQII
jgi:hypothetical protein